MKRYVTNWDYAEFIIKIKMNIQAIEKAMNDKRIDEAKFLANELRANTVLLIDSIEREERRIKARSQD